MSKKKDKYTPDVLAVGVVALAGSAVFQRALLQPKTEIKITDNVKIPVMGILPFSQQYLASVSRIALNEVLPITMNVAVNALEKLHVREEFKKGVLWFVYDFMGKYSFNTVVSTSLRHFNIVDKEKYKDVLRELIQKIITEKTDRDALIKTATGEIVRIMRLITEGTIASMIFNDRFAEAASTTIAAAIDRFLDNEAAGRLTDYLLKFIGQLEDITLPNLMNNVFGIGREELSNFIDTAYDAILGERTVAMVREMHAGDIAYELITSIDYDDVYNYMTNSMNSDLLKLNVSGAMTAMSFYAGAKRLAKKHYEKKDKRDAFRQKVKKKRKDKAEETEE